jgi:pyruvate kinase
MRHKCKAKIVATLGPASSSPELIRALFAAGADVFRFNFSHGTHRDHGTCYESVRELECATGRPIAVLADLQGPKLRVGTFNERSVTLRAGGKFRLDLDETPGDAHRVSLPHPEIFQALNPGDELLLDDGKVRLVVDSCGPGWAETDVVVGGALSERKGVNVVGVVPLSALTEKDRHDLAFALELGAD